MSARVRKLERHGRAYGGLRLAIAFTVGLEGDHAKTVLAAGWDKTRPLANAEQGAAILRHRGERRNPAVVLRPSGLIGIDVDGAEGVALLHRLVPEGMPRSVGVVTGKDHGYHVWLRAPEDAATAFVELGPEGVKAKTNQYLVAPPSVHPSGREYRFAQGRAPWEQELAVLPADLLERLERAARVERNQRAAASGPIITGGRHDYLMRLGCAMRRRGAGEATIAAALLVENRDRCQPPKDEALVLNLAADIARRYQPGVAT
jgi:putative DNA primase/helicase